MIYDEGFSKMLERGYLYIDSMQDKIDLGLEPYGATEPENIRVLTDDKIKDMLIKYPITTFKGELKKYNDAQINALVNYAIANEVLDAEKCSLLKDITGIDILKAVALNRDLAKADRKD